MAAGFGSGFGTPFKRGVVWQVVVVVVLLGLAGAWFAVSAAASSVEHRITVKGGQLSQVLALRGEYRDRQAGARVELNRLRRSRVRLVSLVEETAKRIEIEIGQLRPENGEPDADGVVESKVDLRAVGLSVDRLTEFITQLKRAPGVVVIRKLKVEKPYRKDTLDIELGISTFGVKG